MSRLFFLLASLFLVSACTKPIDVPTGSYGFVLRLGYVKNVVLGPGQIDRAPMIDNLILIDELHNIELNDGKYSIRYRVVDPVKYYLTFGGNISILPRVQMELANQSLNGKAINSREELYDLVEGLKLPIELLSGN